MLEAELPFRCKVIGWIDGKPVYEFGILSVDKIPPGFCQDPWRDGYLLHIDVSFVKEALLSE